MFNWFAPKIPSCKFRIFCRDRDNNATTYITSVTADSEREALKKAAKDVKGIFYLSSWDCWFFGNGVVYAREDA